MFLCKVLPVCCWPSRNDKSSGWKGMGDWGKKRISPASNRSHQARARASVTPPDTSDSSDSSMVTRGIGAALASGNLAAEPQRAEEDETRGQNDACGREGDVFVAGGKRSEEHTSETQS